MADHIVRIGLLADFLSSEFSENLINGVTSCCKDLGIELIVFQIGEIKHKKHDYTYQYVAITSQISHKNLDGIIITSGTQLHGMSKTAFLSYLHSFKPLKIVNISMNLKDIPSIMVNADKAFESLISYLIKDQNCRKFGFMTVDSKAYEVTSRNSIFYKTLKKHGIEKEDVIVWESNFEYSSSYDVLREHTKKNKKIDVDAIVALNDDMAYACMDFCKNQLNLRVPEDVVVTGFDDLQRASFSDPTLSSINQKVAFQGYKAAQTLYNLIKGEEVPLIQTIQAQAILRQSTNKQQIIQDNINETEFIKLDKSSVSDFTSKFSVSEWYKKRSQIYQAASMYTNMQYDVSVNDLKHVVTGELKYFGFQAVAVVMYENPVEMDQPFEYFNSPSKAYLIAGFDYTTDFSVSDVKELITFNPNESILPDRKYFDFTPEGSIALSLFHNEIQYGYVVFRRGDYDMGVYDLVSKTITNQIAIARTFDKMMKENNEIQDRYMKLDLIAHSDELTGLSNRRGFMELGRSMLNFSEAMGQSGLILFCDMDGLKKINDTYGHDWGDVAIKAQGQILKNSFRSNDLIARLGGDEFAVICPGLTVKNFKVLKNKINKDCREWSKENEYPFELSISLGYSVFPSKEYAYDFDALLKASDNSLYKEKRLKKSKKTHSAKEDYNAAK